MLGDLVLFGVYVQVDATFVAELVMTKQAVEQVGVPRVPRVCKKTLNSILSARSALLSMVACA